MKRKKHLCKITDFFKRIPIHNLNENENNGVSKSSLKFNNSEEKHNLNVNIHATKDVSNMGQIDIIDEINLEAETNQPEEFYTIKKVLYNHTEYVCTLVKTNEKLNLHGFSTNNRLQLGDKIYFQLLFKLELNRLVGDNVTLHVIGDKKLENITDTNINEHLLSFNFKFDENLEYKEVVIQHNNDSIIAYTKNNIHVFINMEKFLLILNPTQLVSCTNVISSLSCPRRAILNYKVKSLLKTGPKLGTGIFRSDLYIDMKTIEGSFELVYGKLAHSLFQQYLMQSGNKHLQNNPLNSPLTNLYDPKYLQQELDILINTLITELMSYETNLECIVNDIVLSDLYDKLFKQIETFILWKNTYMPNQYIRGKQRPIYTKETSQKGSAILPKKPPFFLKKLSKVCKHETHGDCFINAIHSTEKAIESRRYGLRGIIDVIFEVDTTNNRRCLNKEPDNNLLIAELKTGMLTKSIEHQGQVMLYNLLLNDSLPTMDNLLAKLPNNYDTSPVDKGVLLYLDHLLSPMLKAFGLFSEKTPNSIRPHEPSDGVRIVESKLKHIQGLIENRNNLVQYMDVKRSISTFSKFTSMHSEAQNIFQFFTNTLPPPLDHISACRRCPQAFTCSLLGQASIENNGPQNSSDIEDLFALDDIQNEDCLNGDCESTFLNIDAIPSTRHKFWLEILKESQLMPKHYSYLQYWYRILHLELIEEERMPINMTCEKSPEDTKIKGRMATKSIVFLGLGNVIELMRPEPVYQTVRTLLFESTNGPLPIHNLHEDALIFDLSLDNSLHNLNAEQRQAIAQVLDWNRRLILIKGFPGTGKTATIVAIIKILYAKCVSVLLAAHTNSALDNILDKLRESGICDCIKFGSSSNETVSHVFKKLIPSKREILSDPAILSQRSDAIRNELRSRLVFASTCSNITKDPLVKRFSYDICIMDEASQISEPLALGPLFLAPRIVMVGDVHQLPPIFKSHSARTLGAEQSLFEKFVLTFQTQNAEINQSKPNVNESNICQIFELREQYRMNSEIIKLSNRLIYENRLVCANSAIASQPLQFAPSVIVDKISQPDWIKKTLSTSIKSSVIFCDLASTNDPATLIEKEFKVLASLLYNLVVNYKFDPTRIGVISPYNKQIEYIKKRLDPSFKDIVINNNENNVKGENLQGLVELIECNTIDKFQGKDKDIIIISFGIGHYLGIKPGNERSKDILTDVRRLNVAFTRAKYKLILISNRTLLFEKYPDLSNVLKHCIYPRNFIQLS